MAIQIFLKLNNNDPDNGYLQTDIIIFLITI